jgi:DNA repair exonuclease SbcCD ATPase subunit
MGCSTDQVKLTHP